MLKNHTKKKINNFAQKKNDKNHSFFVQYFLGIPGIVCYNHIKEVYGMANILKKFFSDFEDITEYKKEEQENQ